MIRNQLSQCIQVLFTHAVVILVEQRSILAESILQFRAGEEDGHDLAGMGFRDELGRLHTGEVGEVNDLHVWQLVQDGSESCSSGRDVVFVPPGNEPYEWSLIHDDE